MLPCLQAMQRDVKIAFFTQSVSGEMFGSSFAYQRQPNQRLGSTTALQPGNCLDVECSAQYLSLVGATSSLVPLNICAVQS